MSDARPKRIFIAIIMPLMFYLLLTIQIKSLDAAPPSNLPEYECNISVVQELPLIIKKTHCLMCHVKRDLRKHLENKYNMTENEAEKKFTNIVMPASYVNNLDRSDIKKPCETKLKQINRALIILGTWAEGNHTCDDQIQPGRNCSYPAIVDKVKFIGGFLSDHVGPLIDWEYDWIYTMPTIADTPVSFQYLLKAEFISKLKDMIQIYLEFSPKSFTYNGTVCHIC